MAVWDWDVLVGWLVREWLAYFYAPLSLIALTGLAAALALFDSQYGLSFGAKSILGIPGSLNRRGDTHFFLLANGSTGPTETFLLFHLESLQNNTQPH